MASLDSPPNPSFAIRDPTDDRHTFLIRSLSSKDPPTTNDVEFPSYPSPPRLSVQLDHRTHRHPPSLHVHPFGGKGAETTTETKTTSYKCVASTTAVEKDGQILAMAAGTSDVDVAGIVYTGTEANVIRVWKVGVPALLTECGQLKTAARGGSGGGGCRVVAIHVAGDRVYGAYGDGKMRIWQRTWSGGGGIGGGGFQHVRVGTIPATGGIVRSYISGAGKDHKTSRHKGPITSLATNISNDILYSASLDKTVKVWRLSDLKCVETITAHSSPINSILVSGSDALLFTASDDATVRVWRRNFCRSGARSHALVVTLPAKQSPVKALALTSDNLVLYGGCSDGYVHFWLKGWLCGQLQYGGALQGHTHAVMGLACSASSQETRYVVSGSADRTCRVWKRESGGGGGGTRHVCLAVLVGHHGPVRSVVVLATRSTWRGGGGGGGGEVVVKEDDDDKDCIVCSGSLDGVLKLWRVTTGRDSAGGGKGILAGGGGGGVGRRLSGNGYEYFEFQQ